MDEYKLIVKYTAENQRMDTAAGSFHPPKQFIHQLRNQPCRRRHKDALIAIKDAFLAPAELTGLLYDIFCHNTVELL